MKINKYDNEKSSAFEQLRAERQELDRILENESHQSQTDI
jgi:hypothetical protein